MRPFIVYRKHSSIVNVPFLEQLQTRTVLLGNTGLDAGELDGQLTHAVLVDSANVERNKVLALSRNFWEDLAPRRSAHKSHIVELDLLQALLGGRQCCKEILG